MACSYFKKSKLKTLFFHNCRSNGFCAVNLLKDDFTDRLFRWNEGFSLFHIYSLFVFLSFNFRLYCFGSSMKAQSENIFSANVLAAATRLSTFSAVTCFPCKRRDLHWAIVPSMFISHPLHGIMEVLNLSMKKTTSPALLFE